MKLSMNYTLIIGSLLALATSCTKKELDDKKYYYGNVAGEIKELPGTPLMDLYANNEKIGPVGPTFGLGGDLTVPAGVPVTIQFRKRDTDVVLLDTNVTVPKYQSVYFNIAYSEDLGIKGFLNNTVVHPDSVKFQVMNKLTAPYDYPDVDLHVVKLNLFTAEVLETITIIPRFKHGQLMEQVITVPNLPDLSSEGIYLAYAGMLKNRQTGEFIIHKAVGVPPFYLFWDAMYFGKFLICVVSNDGGDYISTNPVVL